MIKKSSFDVCGGDCSCCERFKGKVFDAVPVLVKKKVHTRYVPPDMTALKMLMDKSERSFNIESMTDEELRKLEVELINSTVRVDE